MSLRQRLRVLVGVLLLLFVFGRTAASCAVRPAALEMPALEQVRVSLGAFDADARRWSVVVSFAADRDAVDEPDKYLPTVRVSPCFAETGAGVAASACCSDEHLGRRTSYTYNVDDHLKKVGFTIRDFYASPWLYHVAIPNAVAPGGKMVYGVGLVIVGPTGEPLPQTNGQNVALFRNTVFEFSAPPAPGAMTANAGGAPPAQLEDERPVRLCVIGDIGQTQFSMKTRDVILAQLDGVGGANGGAGATLPPPALAMIVGDMSYADGGAQRWDSWGRMMEPLAAKMPVMVLVGNHEIEIDNKTHATFEHYRHRFIMPDGGRPEHVAPASHLDAYREYGRSMRYQGGSSYYSLDVGPLHIVTLNVYDTAWHYDKEIPNLQREFFENDLAKYDTPGQREITPFIIVFMHAPWYNSNTGHQGEIATRYLREWAEPLILKHNVDAVFAGHVHAYERFRGVGKGGTAVKRDDSAPIYITIGDGGNHELFYNKWMKKPAASAYRNGEFYGHGDLVAWNRTHLEWVWKPNPEQGEAATESPDRAWIAPRSARALNNDGPTTGGMTGWQYFSVLVLSLGGVALTAYFVVYNVQKRRAAMRNAPPLGVGRHEGLSFQKMQEEDVQNTDLETLVASGINSSSPSVVTVVQPKINENNI